jgi:hypothetical protein
MRNYFLLALIFISLVSKVDAQVKVCQGGECFPQSSFFNNQKYPLAGTGLFRYWGFKVYAIALYADPEDALKATILNPLPKRLVIHYFRDFEAKDFRESQKLALENPFKMNLDDLKSKLIEMEGLYRPVKKGDEYSITFIPGVGTQLELDGEILGTVEGDDFQKAYFGIWLSDNSVKESLRRQLLPR